MAACFTYLARDYLMSSTGMVESSITLLATEPSNAHALMVQGVMIVSFLHVEFVG